MAKKFVKRAFFNTLPVMAGYIVLGMGFGIMMHSKGYGILWALFMSVFIYAGAMQYLAVDLLTGGASLITAAITTLMVNARHLFYGISMVDKYKDTGKTKPYLIFALTDETYSLVCGEEEKDKKYYLLVSLFNHIYWITGTLLGSALGALISFNTKGIDFALTALFLTVLVEQWQSTKEHAYAIIGLASSVLCLLLFGADGFLIPSMLLITLALTVYKRVKAGGGNE